MFSSGEKVLLLPADFSEEGVERIFLIREESNPVPPVIAKPPTAP